MIASSVNNINEIYKAMEAQMKEKHPDSLLSRWGLKLKSNHGDHKTSALFKLGMDCKLKAPLQGIKPDNAIYDFYYLHDDGLPSEGIYLLAVINEDF